MSIFIITFDFYPKMNQVSNWLDLSSIYNSRRNVFDAENRNRNSANRAKLILDNRDGGKGFMPSCPLATRCVHIVLNQFRAGGAGGRLPSQFFGKVASFSLKLYEKFANSNTLLPPPPILRASAGPKLLNRY